MCAINRRRDTFWQPKSDLHGSVAIGNSNAVRGFLKRSSSSSSVLLLSSFGFSFFTTLSCGSFFFCHHRAYNSHFMSLTLLLVVCEKKTREQSALRVQFFLWLHFYSLAATTRECLSFVDPSTLLLLFFLLLCCCLGRRQREIKVNFWMKNGMENPSERRSFGQKWRLSFYLKLLTLASHTNRRELRGALRSALLSSVIIMRRVSDALQWIRLEFYGTLAGREREREGRAEEFWSSSN